MNRIADCVGYVVEACGADDEATALASGRLRIDKFFDDLAAHLKEWPQQDGSRESGALRDQLTAASEQAVRRGAVTVSDRLERMIDYVQAQPRGQ